MIVAFTGKGGTGKTLLAALTVLELLDRYPDADLLVVDADPDANVPDVLGVEVDTTLGEVRERFKREIERDELPPGFDKQAYMEYLVMTALQEFDGYDLLVMGRSEGRGCYCAVNHWLRRIMRELLPEYDYVVMDCEAGLEHVSRGIIEGVDLVLTVVDHSYKSLKTAARIARLIEELETEVGEMWVVANRVTSNEYEVIREKGEELGLRFAGFVRPDEEVIRLELHGRPLTELPPDAKVRRDVCEILTRVGVLRPDG